MNVIDPVDDLAARPGPIVIGELHGTNEIPALVGALVARAIAAGRAVQLCLEMPPSALEPGHRGWFWGTRDGRSSTAMVALVGDARQRGATVVGIQPELLDAEEFDRHEVHAAALLLAAVRARPDAFTVVLVGNGHSWADGDGSFYATAPLAALAAAELQTLRTVRVAVDGGTAWFMTGERPDGGVHDVPPAREHWPRGLHWHDGLREHHHATWAIGPVTASGPARRR